ncbi:target of Myb1 membrane trafficking protein isoform X2 [Eucyclogobius newberryi]|uniref:target of Myb1 membrane trafficking protein isoform X2 n=1 Tax=Eucyclogobius newberryi TaxID=166745 RepID=UPI003B5B91E7
MEFFLGNPFSSAVGQLIEKATSSSLPSEDWALNMQICDVVNTAEEGPRDAVRAIKKRVVGNKNFKEVMMTLTVLETCVKNCGFKLHVLVTTRDFIEGVLVRAIIPRNNPPEVLHDRVLGIIQAWADAFRSSPDLTGVVSVYEDLRRKGLEFPTVELEGYSSRQNHKETSPGNGPTVTALHAGLISTKLPLQQPQSVQLKHAKEENNAYTPSQVQQLKTELAVVRSNLTTMSEMMSQLDPVTVKQADTELLELYSVCKEMQEKIVKVVPRLSEERLIEELLATNDEMNTAFSRYQRFEKRISNGQHETQKEHTYVNLADLTPESGIQSGAASAESDGSLSQSQSGSLCGQMTKLSTSEAEDLHAFLHRTSEQSEIAVDTQTSRLRPGGADESPVSTNSSSPKLDWMIKRGMIPLSQANVMDDIEQWLSLEDDYDDYEDSDGVTSEEFDKFLAERAKVADRLPSIRSSSQDQSTSES